MQVSSLSVAPHLLEQAYKAIRTTPPEQKDLELSSKLQAYMDEKFPTESPQNIKRRSMILAELNSIFREWVKQVCIQKGIPEDIAADAGGHIYVSGSYRLGVNEPGADIDTICVAPRHITREDFFTTLKEILYKHPKVTNLIAIEGAIVPLITFDYEEINIDLQIAILPKNTIPENLNILDDQILVGVDPATEKSLNGPRVTELMIKLTPNRDSFISVLRIVRRWAKRRGLYSNKMGYLGGVNYCILVCFINQLYPTAAPSTLLLRFFMVLSNWKWPLAIQLCKTHDAKLGLEVWNASVGNNRYQVMPILTPAYPSMNSSYNVSNHSLAVMKEEFKKALDVVQEIISKGGINWDPLFEPSDFFATHQYYLAVDVYTTNEDDEQAWTGFCESRMRKLIESLAYIPPLCRLRAFPKKYPLCFVQQQEKVTTTDDNKSTDTIESPPPPTCSTTDDLVSSPLKKQKVNSPSKESAAFTASEEENKQFEKQQEQEPKKYGVCFFVAFDIDKKLLRTKELNIDNSVDYFKHNDLYRWNKRTEEMDVKITPVVWKNLPECVFEDLGGRAIARNIRREYTKKKKEEEAKAAAEQSASAATNPTSDATAASASPPNQPIATNGNSMDGMNPALDMNGEMMSPTTENGKCLQENGTNAGVAAATINGSTVKPPTKAVATTVKPTSQIATAQTGTTRVLAGGPPKVSSPRNQKEEVN